jgi:hypothetical protein
MTLRPESRAELDMTDEECRLIKTPPMDEAGLKRSYEAFQKWERLRQHYYNLAHPPDAGDL